MDLVTGGCRPCRLGLRSVEGSNSGRVWALEAGGRHGWAVATVGSAGAAISAIGEDEDGEIWFADLTGDRLLRLEATEIAPPPRRGGGRVAP